MTELELHAMYAAHCRCCLLSAAMKDCAHCVFNVLEPETVAEATRASYGDGPEDGWLIGNNMFTNFPEWTEELSPTA